MEKGDSFSDSVACFFFLYTDTVCDQIISYSTVFLTVANTVMF